MQIDTEAQVADNIKPKKSAAREFFEYLINSICAFVNDWFPSSNTSITAPVHISRSSIPPSGDSVQNSKFTESCLDGVAEQQDNAPVIQQTLSQIAEKPTAFSEKEITVLTSILTQIPKNVDLLSEEKISELTDELKELSEHLIATLTKQIDLLSDKIDALKKSPIVTIEGLGEIDLSTVKKQDGKFLNALKEEFDTEMNYLENFTNAVKAGRKLQQSEDPELQNFGTLLLLASLPIAEESTKFLLTGMPFPSDEAIKSYLEAHISYAKMRTDLLTAFEKLTPANRKIVNTLFDMGKGLDFKAFAILPIQRLPRHELTSSAMNENRPEKITSNRIGVNPEAWAKSNKKFNENVAKNTVPTADQSLKRAKTFSGDAAKGHTSGLRREKTM